MTDTPPRKPANQSLLTGWGWGAGAIRSQTIREAVIHGGLLLLFFYGLDRSSPADGVMAGAVFAATVLAVIHGLLWYRLLENRAGAALLPAATLGTANRLTLLRGLLISLTAGFLFVDPSGGAAGNALAWLPGALYLAAAVLDGVDGAWARRTGTQSALGKALDNDIDALGVLVASSVAVAGGRLPPYYLSAGLVYYLYQLGLWGRRLRGLPLYPPPPRKFARVVAGVQMAFLGIALLPVLPRNVLALAAPVFLLPLLAGFVRDWMTVRGAVRRTSKRWFQAMPTSGGSRALLVQILILAAIAGLLWWALRDVSPAAVWAAIGLWHWPQWLFFAGVNLIILGAMCWRWWLILRRMGHPVGFRVLVPCRMAANTVSYITPGPQFGGEPLQVLCLTERRGVPPAAATAAVGVDRLTELMGNLVFLSVCGVFILAPLINARSALIWTTLGMGAVVLAAGGLLRAVARGRAPLSRMTARFSRWKVAPQRMSRLVAFLQAGEHSAAGVLTGGLPGWYAGIGAVQWLAFLGELWVIYAFLGFPMQAHALLTVAVAARLAFLLPLPGGLGALEAGQLLALVSLGGNPDLAAAACAVMRLRDIVLMSIGGVFAARRLRAGRPPEATRAGVADPGRGP